MRYHFEIVGQIPVGEGMVDQVLQVVGELKDHIQFHLGIEREIGPVFSEGVAISLPADAAWIILVMDDPS
jgi:hypothetical protein